MQLLATVWLLTAAGVAPLLAADTLTLPQALDLAARHHPQLAVAAAQQQGAEAAIRTASAYPNPEAGYLAGHQHPRMLGAVPGLNQVYSFAQPIETRAVRQSRIQAATLGRTTAVLATSEAKLMVQATVRRAFSQALLRQDEIELATGNLKLIEELRRRIQAQVDSGESPRLELIRADAELSTARILLQSAQLRLASALAALGAAIGAPLPEETRVTGALDTPAAVPGMEALLAEILERSPVYQQTQAEIRRLTMRLAAEQALRRPQPTLRAEYEQQPDVATYRLGFSLPVPLWNKREGPIAEAAAALRVARATADLRRLEIASALQAALSRYTLAGQQIASYEQGAIRQAEAALRGSEAAYRFGERGIIEVLDAQRLLRNARLDLLNARYERQSAWIELETLRASNLEGSKP